MEMPGTPRLATAREALLVASYVSDGRVRALLEAVNVSTEDHVSLGVGDTPTEGKSGKQLPGYWAEPLRVLVNGWAARNGMWFHSGESGG